MYQTVPCCVDVCLPTVGVISAGLENKLRKTYAMYREGIMSNSVSTMRRNEGNRRRDAKMRRMARGVVSRADWYAIVKSSASAFPQ